jgi:glycosyltransferase involved in cell wall biosynthesis
MNAIIRVLTRILYPSADAIICVSQGIRDEMRELLGQSNKLSCIYNPLDVDYIQAQMVTPPYHPWFIERNEPVIVSAGRLTRQKDYPTLLHAFALLVSKNPARLIILGQGDDEAALKTLAGDLSIADRVFFAGFQDNPFSWIHASDLYVLSSRWEGLPGTLLEALACSARIVSTDCRTGPAEILESGKWGRLVPVGAPSELALAMAAALEDENPPATEHRADSFRIQYALDGYTRVMKL